MQTRLPAASLLLLLVLLGCYGTVSASQRTVTVSNVAPRVDSTTNQTLDIHDGNTLFINGTFFWYGAGYGYCAEMKTGCASNLVGSCGFQLNHTVNLATSTDLKTWTFHGAVLPVANRPHGIMFSPWVAQSPETGLFVLWTNILPVINGHGNFEASYYAVFTAPTPFGPFTVANPKVTGVAYQQLPDAPSIFVDDDGSSYVAFTHEKTHINSVQQLAPNLTHVAVPNGNVSPVIGTGNQEGILMFKRDGLYWVGVGQCCCFCKAGTGVELYSSKSALGPYEARGQVARYPNGTSIWQAQTGSVFFTGSDFVLYGDRWQSAPGPTPIKAFDFSYMVPLRWDADGTPQSIGSFQDEVDIVIAAP